MRYIKSIYESIDLFSSKELLEFTINYCMINGLRLKVIQDHNLRTFNSDSMGGTTVWPAKGGIEIYGYKTTNGRYHILSGQAEIFKGYKNHSTSLNIAVYEIPKEIMYPVFQKLKNLYDYTGTYAASWSKYLEDKDDSYRTRIIKYLQECMILPESIKAEYGHLLRSDKTGLWSMEMNEDYEDETSTERFYFDMIYENIWKIIKKQIGEVLIGNFDLNGDVANFSLEIPYRDMEKIKKKIGTNEELTTTLGPVMLGYFKKIGEKLKLQSIPFLDSVELLEINTMNNLPFSAYIFDYSCTLNKEQLRANKTGLWSMKTEKKSEKSVDVKRQKRYKNLWDLKNK